MMILSVGTSKIGLKGRFPINNTINANNMVINPSAIILIHKLLDCQKEVLK